MPHWVSPRPRDRSLEQGSCSRIVHHRANGASVASLVVADEDHSVQPGTSSWASFGTRPDDATTDVETREES